MLPEIIAADSQKTFALGRGLATGCGSLAEYWNHLRDEFLKISEGERKPQLLSGFLASAMARSTSEAETLLDGVLADPRLHPYLLYWQVNAGVNGKAFERMMKALAIDTVPVSSFVLLANGRAHEGLDDEQLHLMLQGIMTKDGGNDVATQVLGMRIFGRLSDQLPISESVKATGREFLAKVELEKGARLDHMIGEVIKAAFDKPEYEEQARAFCTRIIAALIEVASESVKVLDTFLQRFRPNGWSGSLADTLATRMPLFDTLKQHPKAEIAAWANKQSPVFATHIDRQRAHEVVEDRARDQTFE